MESSASSADRSDKPGERHPRLADVRLLGVLSDTHGRPDATAAAIATLRAAGAEYFIHCGDVGGEAILDLLAGIPCSFVWGNNDYDRKSLARYAEELGVQCCDDFGELEIGHKKLAVTHGDSPRLLQRATDPDAGFDYLFVGHTHIPTLQKSGRLKIVNPGALHRAAKKTVATVDLTTDAVRHLIVKI